MNNPEYYLTLDNGFTYGPYGSEIACKRAALNYFTSGSVDNNWPDDLVNFCFRLATTKAGWFALIRSLNEYISDMIVVCFEPNEFLSDFDQFVKDRLKQVQSPVY